MAAPTAPEGLTVRHLVMLRSADSFAPTIPTGVTVNGGSGTVTVTHDASSDPDGGTVGGSGVASYSYYRDGVLQETVAASPGLSLRLTRNEIGGITPLPSHTQSAATYTITSAGSGIETATPDECTTLSALVSGDVTVIAKITSFATAGIDYCKAGLMIRAGTGQTDAYYAITQLGNIGLIQPRYRAATLGTSTTDSVSVANTTYPVWLKLTRAGNTYTSYWSTDGNTWALVHATTFTLPANAYVGLVVTSTTPGTNVTAQFQQVNVNNVPTVSWTQTYSGSGTYTITATDRSSPPNVSAPSTGVSLAASTTKKWNPGQYIRADAQGYPSKDTQHYAAYDKALPIANIKGCEIPVNWYRTNPSAGVYDWTYVDAHINRITQNRTNNKRVLLVTQFQNYGGTVPTAPYDADNATLPNYILSAGWGATRTSSGVMPKLDIAACMDAFILWLQAIAAKYDNDPYVELFTVGETSSAYAGMNAANYATQWRRLPAVLKAAWTRTFTVISHNGLTSPTTSIQLNADMVANGIGIGVEDAAGFYGAEPAQYGGWGYYAYAGVGVYDDGDGNGPVNYGTTDSRLSAPNRAEQQVVRSNVVTLAQVNALMNNHWKNSHSVWAVYFDESGVSYTPDFYGTSTPATAYSGTNIINFLSNSANAVTRTAYPTG